MTWWRRRKQGPSPETVAARRQLEQAHEDLAAARADDDRIDQVNALTHQLARRNHLGPMITDALRIRRAG